MPQTDCVFAPWRSEFRVVAAQAVPRGQQVLINYGSQSNDALLQRYGFVEDGNPQDRCVREYGSTTARTGSRSTAARLRLPWATAWFVPVTKTGLVKGSVKEQWALRYGMHLWNTVRSYGHRPAVHGPVQVRAVRHRVAAGARGAAGGRCAGRRQRGEGAGGGGAAGGTTKRPAGGACGRKRVTKTT